MKYLKSKSFFLLALVSSLLLLFFVLLPLFQSAMAYVTLYRQALVEPFPRIELRDGSLTFLDPVPFKINVQDKVEIICEKEPDLEYFGQTYDYSILISEELIAWKTPNEFESFNVSEINVDDQESVIVEPTEISRFIDKYAKIILIIATIIALLLFYLFSLLVVLIGGGIAFMVDAFQEGHITFTMMTNISAPVFLAFEVFVLIWNQIAAYKLYNPFLLIPVFLLIMAFAGWVMHNRFKVISNEIL